MRLPRFLSSYVPVVGLAGLALLASGCGRIASTVVPGGGPNETAVEMLQESVERDGGTNLRVLASETRPDGSSAFGVYVGQMEFEQPGVLEPAECWSYQSVVRGNGGSASGVGGCIRSGEPVPPGGDWSWAGDDPNRILGTIDAGAKQVEVVYKDGEAERFTPLHATSPFQRSFFAVVLSRPVEDVESLTAIFD